VSTTTRKAIARSILICAAGLAAALPAVASPAVAAAPASTIAANSTVFSGYRAIVPASSSSQTVIQVANTGACGGVTNSVAVGAIQFGSGGVLGARIYSQCISGSQVIFPAFETTGGPVAMSTIGALAPGNFVLIMISTSGGLTTVTASGPNGTDTMTVPDIVSSAYHVGIWPLFATGAPSFMGPFGTLKFQKNVVNSAPLGTLVPAPVKVKLVTTPPVTVRAKASNFNSFGDVFKVKWIAP
jgi:hypothetical protein